MLPLHEFLDLDHDGRDGRFPYIWTVDRQHRLSRLLVDEAMVTSCEERRDFWTMLRGLAGVDRKEPNLSDIEARVQKDVVQRIALGLHRIASGDEGDVPLEEFAAATEAGTTEWPAGAVTPEGDYMAPWIDTDDCTACDECTILNPSVFEYNADKKAVFKDPEAGPYSDLVKAAEKCTAQVIHPGLPRDRSAADIDKWIARGSKFN
jgi:pyruvate-ferredoxin/flavodoxin oxidoreductase